MDWTIFTKHRTGIEQRSIENNNIFLVPYKISKFRINDFIVSLLRFVLMFSQEFRLAIKWVFIGESFVYSARPTGTLVGFKMLYPYKF